MVLRDERTVVPIGSSNRNIGVTLSLPSVVGHGGVIRSIEPEMSGEERQALEAGVANPRAIGFAQAGYVRAEPAIVQKTRLMDSMWPSWPVQWRKLPLFESKLSPLTASAGRYRPSVVRRAPVLETDSPCTPSRRRRNTSSDRRH